MRGTNKNASMMLAFGGYAVMFMPMLSVQRHSLVREPLR